MPTVNYIIKTNEIWGTNPDHPADVQAPNIAKIKHGFDYGEKPSHATFNWIMNKVMSSAVMFQQNGILPHDSGIDYALHAITQDSAGDIYQSKKAKNKDPLSNQNSWKKGIVNDSQYIKKVGNTQSDTTGGEMTGDLIIKRGAKLIIEA